jgi:hypothetical protein
MVSRYTTLRLTQFAMAMYCYATDYSGAPVRWLSMSLRNRSYWNRGLTPAASQPTFPRFQ